MLAVPLGRRWPLLIRLCFSLICMFPGARPSAWHMVASQIFIEKDELLFFHLLTDFDLGFNMKT